MSAVDIPAEVHTALDSSSISILSQQHTHHFLHIVGQQESRLPAEKKMLPLYFILASGTTDKHALGCSIWVSRFLPYLRVSGRSFCPSSQHLFVVYAILRILVVDVDAPYLRMRLISAHAPIAEDYSARTVFFDSLSKIVVHPHRGFP